MHFAAYAFAFWLYVLFLSTLFSHFLYIR